MMTPEEFAAEMKRIASDRRYDDTGEGHYLMDKLLCRVLQELGYEAGVEIFEDTGKWYE